MMGIQDINDAIAEFWLIAAGVGAVIVLVMLVLLIMMVSRAGRSAQATERVAVQVNNLGQAVMTLGSGQEQLQGSLRTVSDSQATGQAQVLQTMELRLAQMQQQVNDRLHENALKAARSMSDMQDGMKETLQGNTVKTTQSLTQLQERLATIDKAQSNIEKLSGDVLSLQDILSNKQTRGAFGEIQLTDIVSKALPAGSYKMQATLSNGKRADCLIDLPNPPGPIVIDSKFPLEAYEALRNANTEWETKEAVKAMRVSVKAHIKAISEKYILEGETADGALMFLPSEAVYAELHANFPELVRIGFAARVWIVSPTTCMATLNTMRAILKDARMREQAGAIRKSLGLLHRDVELIVERVDKLNRHFGQARGDMDLITVAAERAGKRANQLDNFDFEEIAPEDDNKVVPLSPPA